jgi:hypothetical protein
MASKGYVISVATDSRLFEQGVRMGIIKPAEEADDALTDLGKNQGLGKLADELKGAQRATDKLGDEARDAARQMQDDYRKTARAARDAADDSSKGWHNSTKKTADETSESMRTVKQEALQNASETFSSFDGSASSFLDGIQGTFGGVIADLGPLGLALGAAGAAGIGFISSALEGAAEKEQQFKQRVGELAQELIDAGNTGEKSVDQIVEKLQELATTGDDAGVTLNKLSDLADASGTDFSSLARAYAGNTNALKEQWRETQRNIDALTDQRDAVLASNDADKSAAVEINNKLKAAKELQGYIGQSIGVAKEAAEEQRNYARAGGPEMEAKRELIQNVNDAYDDAAGSVDDYVNAESGVFDTDKYITAMQAKEQSLRDYQKNLASFEGSAGPEATAYLESLGTEQAATLLGAYQKASTDQQAQLAQIWAEAGKQNSAGYMTNLKAGLPATVAGPDIVAKWKVDDSALKRAIAAQTNVEIPVTVVGYHNGARVW